MADDVLRYDRMVEAALREVVREALLQTVEHGLPGEHHFYLTFKTGAPGVSVPDFLRDQYPDEMTIVMQHQFWDLRVGEDAFEVTLSFKNRPAELHIPFAALTAFVDPSVKFGLQFSQAIGPVGGLPALRRDGELVPVPDNVTGSEGAGAGEGAGLAGEAGGSAEVVNLDQFRKK